MLVRLFAPPCRFREGELGEWRKLSVPAVSASSPKAFLWELFGSGSPLVAFLGEAAFFFGLGKENSCMAKCRQRPAFPIRVLAVGQ